jgi:hypothetical protein
MKHVDWNKVLFRCSCLGKIMAEGKGSVLTEKQHEAMLELMAKESRTPKQQETLDSLIAKKNAPPSLGDTCISYLKEIYIFEKYGKEPVGGSERNKYTMKGLIVEDESIMLLSRLDSQLYAKNERRHTNEYLTGHPDISILDNDGNITKIIDIKSSFDFATLLSNIGSPLNPLYKYQVQGYMALTGASIAEVCYVLVNMPMEMINSEKKRIFYAVNAATEDSPEYKCQVERLENSMTFDEVPINERVIRFQVDRDEAMIEKIYKRVSQCREWLEQFDAMYSHLNK